jgi:hypothetical protein
VYYRSGMNKMKLYEFLRLREANRYNKLWSAGIQVDTDIGDNIAINLYIANDFYYKV